MARIGVPAGASMPRTKGAHLACPLGDNPRVEDLCTEQSRSDRAFTGADKEKIIKVDPIKVTHPLQGEGHFGKPKIVHEQVVAARLGFRIALEWPIAARETIRCDHGISGARQSVEERIVADAGTAVQVEHGGRSRAVRKDTCGAPDVPACHPADTRFLTRRRGRQNHNRLRPCLFDVRLTGWHRESLRARRENKRK